MAGRRCPASGAPQEPFRSRLRPSREGVMVRLEEVGLHYGSGGRPTPPVLHGLTFSIPEGAFRWLLGPSGAGKTSLLRLLYLAARPTSGRLNLFGTDIGSASRSKLALLRR